MAAPSKKSLPMLDFLDDVSESLFGTARTVSINTNKCVLCKGTADKFTDASSQKEYTISGMCQSCQDKTFGTGEE